MEYHEPTKSFVVTVGALERAAADMKWAIQNVRRQAGLPLGPHATETPMDAAQFAEAAILSAARNIGINLGAQRPGQLDVREAP